ncbi:MAG: hypothetical protein COB53_00095 [Elusimicrobia bacterium]|nr:MAG: hypothetical protein COB53_00095 [Elusimicrobiota bacterium]
MIRIVALLALLTTTARAEMQSPDALLRDHLWRQVQTLEPGQRPRVGLVLSAGSVRGLAHIGVIHVLHDAGFPIDIVAGTSMGAVIGSFFSGGYSMEKMWSVGAKMRMNSGNNFSKIRLISLILNDQLLSSAPLEKLLNDGLGDRRFDQLDKPFACVAMDISTGEKIIFRDGPLAPAVRASMNMPGIFKPVLYRHRYLVDGGVVDYVPVDAAKLLGAEWILASVTEGDYSNDTPTNVLGALEQVIDIRGAILSRQQRREADYLIEPEVGKIAYYDVSRSVEVMERGMRAARKQLQGAKDNYILRSLPGLWSHWKPKQ